MPDLDLPRSALIHPIRRATVAPVPASSGRWAAPVRVVVVLLGMTTLGDVGCGAKPDLTPLVKAPARPRPDDPRSSGMGGPGRFGVGAHAEYVALADQTSALSRDPGPFRFADIQPASGIDFVHVSGSDQRKLYPTAFGSGVALFDFDGDGRLDLYFATFAPLPRPDGAGPGPTNKLYRNLGDGHFADATAAAGLGFAGYCHGIIVGDVDNDGDPDVFLANFGGNALFRNEGNGTFRDISRQAGVDRPGWSIGGAMLDHDGDGDLDLYVANYGDWQYPRDARACGTERVPLFCSPHEIPTTRHFFYRNNGDGTFTDVAESVGLGRTDGHGFAAVAADYNGDGRVDLYVANDLNPNFLYLNRGDGTFEDVSVDSGAAVDAWGVEQSSMGLDVEDADGDGRPEILVSNFQNEHIAYYRNVSVGEVDPTGAIPPALFQEESGPAGLGADSRAWVGWGCALADFDNDGRPDVFVANGQIDANRADLAPTMTYPQPPLLFRNVEPGGGDFRRFRLATRDVGPYFTSRHVARGAAFGDLDDDGDLDIVVNHMDGPPAILRNETPTAHDHAWIRLELVGTQSHHDAIGARVEVVAGGRTIVRQRKSGASLSSANDPRLLIGLGAVATVDRVTIRWPSGHVSQLNHPALRQTHRVAEPAIASDR